MTEETEKNDVFLIARIPRSLKTSILEEARQLGHSLSEYVRSVLRERKQN